jgi:diguanylate cyclase (GGDEF)-like protein
VTRSSRHAKRRVLVVDDDPTFAMLAAEALEQAAFLVKIAGTAQEAIAAFATFTPDLVLLDVNVPGGNGYDLCRRIRAADSNSDVPVIMVTGLDDTESIDRAYEAGATDFLHKPVLWPTLPHSVDFMLRALDDRRALVRSQRKTRALLEALPDAIATIDRRGIIAEHLTGSDEPAEEQPLVGKRLEEAFPPDLAQAARQALAGRAEGSRANYEFAVGTGQNRRWLEARLRPQGDGSLLIITRDVTERHRAKAHIEYLAYYDILTGLPNRQLFVRKARKLLNDSSRCTPVTAVLYIDLDRFKRVNDNVGHVVGNELLRNVSKRIAHQLRKGARDYVGSTWKAARLGGDEFVVLVAGLADDGQAADIAEQLRTALAEPLHYGDHNLVVTASIGLAMHPSDSTDIEDLLVKADMAMYLAKDQGRNRYEFFGQSMAVRSLGRLELETQMRRALERGEFHLCYQPKLDLRTGAIVGVEALLRWKHPERGAVPPDTFIPVAEETGLIVPLGAWVVREVCEQLGRWSSGGLGHLTAAVNVSVQQFARGDFVDMVFGALQHAGVEPTRLELEITESLLMRNVADTSLGLTRLRDHGISLSIDDFGTGYSSLGYLRQLPVSVLKIDRSFVKDLETSADASAICSAIIAMARELNLKVVAEGVETPGQLALLRQHGCDQAQGFLIAAPVSVAELEPLLRSAGKPGSTRSNGLKRSKASEAGVTGLERM